MSLHINGGTPVSINAVEERYDYCRIKYQVQDAGYDPSHAEPHKLIWGQFMAVFEGSTDSYVVARSERFPLSNIIGGQPYPDSQNMGHSNMLDIFIERLENDGWELARPYNSDLWWEKRLRRPHMPKKQRQTLKERLTAAFAFA